MTQTAREKATHSHNGQHDPFAMSSQLLKLLPSNPMLAVTKEVIALPVATIAKELNKDESELTAFDVSVYTYTNMPKMFCKTMVELTTQNMALWQSNMHALQSMFSSVGFRNPFLGAMK